MSAGADWILPGWPAPARVRAVSTTRIGGISVGPWRSLNLGVRGGDDPAAVEENRRRLAAACGWTGQPAWLAQVHGADVLALADPPAGEPRADGAVADAPGRVCVVLTADCLPVLLCDRAGTRVGALHAGWRGLAAGVVEAGVAAMDGPGASLLAWLGPCIGQAAFEVGPEVRDAFLAADPGCGSCFLPGRGDRWHADLRALARRRLAGAGVTEVHEDPGCTWSDARRFYSHRRDGETGRMATAVWLADAPRA